ncbi:MAG: protein kinase, partial [Bacteroidota bacterium]
MKQQRKFSDSYTLHELLGEGGFAKVRRCTHKPTGTACAAKIFDLKKCSRKDIEALKLEANVMRKLSHPNIVRIYASLPEGHQHYFVLELLEGGELFDDIVARDHYSEVDASSCMKQVWWSFGWSLSMCLLSQLYKQIS